MTGTYEHSIDAKGRLFIPAKLREELGVTFYLAMGVDACLAMGLDFDDVSRRIKKKIRDMERERGDG